MPDTVLLHNAIVLFVSVSVVALPTRVSVALGKVIVLSAVGSVTVSVVSKSSAVAPSNIILPVVVESPVIAGVAIVGLVSVLFVSVSDPVKETKLSPCKALLNSDREPVTVLFAKSIVLFVRAIVEPAIKVFNCPNVALPSVPLSETKNISVNSSVTEVKSFAPSRLITSATLPNSKALAPELTLIT